MAAGKININEQTNKFYRNSIFTIIAFLVIAFFALIAVQVPSPVQQTPTVCEPNWQCGEWSECTSGTQTRFCTDLNACEAQNIKPETATCTALPADVPIEPTGQGYQFTIYENIEPYYGDYCDKIDPYNLDVRMAASTAKRNHPGSYNIDQLLDIYDWVRENIAYQNVPLGGIPYPPSETLMTQSGDCKNQAVLIASMVEAIGGDAKVVLDPSCEHSYAIVRFGPADMDMQGFVDTISAHYGHYVYVEWFTSENSNWVKFDPAGGAYPGNTLPECSGERTVYFVTSCLGCINQYQDLPYTYGDSCSSQCPQGTYAVNQYACA